jgi:hypothetical protein
MIELKDLLRDKDLDPKHVLVLRHCFTKEPNFNKVLPRLAAEKPDLFNAIQRHQSKKNVEGAINRAKYVAAFIGHEPGKALFVGLYSVKGKKPISREEYWAIRENVQLKKEYGGRGWAEEDVRPSRLWFDLVMTDFYSEWKGKLIVKWPPQDRSWFRLADRNFPIHAILEESALVEPMPEWDKIDLEWKKLVDLPASWKSKLTEWRGVYYIFDTSDHKGYVGSAYGENNLLGRWKKYAASGHGGNRLLRPPRDPRNFRFTILELDARNRDPNHVIQLENSWKQRLHTHHPDGLNDN